MIAEASPILSFLLAKGLGAKTLSQIVEQVVREDFPFEELLTLSPSDLADRMNLRPAVAESVLAAHDEAETIARELQRQQVHVLIRGLEPYPQRLAETLGDIAPPVLFARGNLELFGIPAVGFCGS